MCLKHLENDEKLPKSQLLFGGDAVGSPGNEKTRWNPEVLRKEHFFGYYKKETKLPSEKRTVYIYIYITYIYIIYII